MSASGVKAGEAYGELTLRDRMSAKLDAARERFMRFGQGMAVAGGATLAIAGGAVAAMAGPVQAFVELGGALQDASDRTGVSAEELSALGFAADQAGVSLASLEGAMKGLAKLAFGASSGASAAAETLSALGVSAETFLAASPAERLSLVAEGLSRIEDPGLRSAVAMRALGRSGADLLPMLSQGAAGLDRMRAEAARLGVVLSGEDVAAADELGDSVAGLNAQAKALAFTVGASLVEPLTAGVGVLKEAAAVAIELAKNNKPLVLGFAALAAVGIVAGLAMLGLAGAGFVLSGAITAVTATFAAASAVVAFLASPIGMVVAGVVALTAVTIAGVVAWARWTESGRSAVTYVTSLLGGLLDVGRRTFGGITDAIIAGEWTLALQVAVGGMLVVWRQFQAGLTVAWQTFIGYFSDSWVVLKNAVAFVLAGLPSLMIQPLAQMQQMVVGWANSIASALGFEVQFDGLDALRTLNDDLAASAKRDQVAIVRGAEDELERNRASRREAIAAAGNAVRDAQSDLDELREKAAFRRSQKAAAAAARVPSDSLGGFGLGGVPSMQGGVLGTFSGAVAGLLGRSTPDMARVAENTERAADLLEEIAGKEGIAWE